MNKLNLAVVGCGDIAGYTALVSRLVPQVRLVACCDINLERALRFSHSHKIPKATADFQEILAMDSVQAVYLAVPHNLHKQMILEAVEAGRHVFVEKPLTSKLSDGYLLLNKLNKSPIKVGVNYQYRYDKGCFALVSAVQRGFLGKINSIRINIPWHRDESYFNNSPWHRTIQQAGGGTLITQGSHFLDIALWALGEEPLYALGFTTSSGFDVEVETLAHGLLETGSGTLVNITSSMIAPKESAVSIEVYGEYGTAFYHDKPFPKTIFKGVRIPKEPLPVKGVHALQRSLKGYANWVLNDQPFHTPSVEALPVLAAVDGIYRSALSGKKEPISRWNE